jgi:hypothetical protein
MARRLQLRSTADTSTIIAGISGNEITAQRVTLKELALGTSDNLMPGPISAAIAQTLPAGVDIVLDPTEAFSPFGYTIDFGAQVLTAFDPAYAGLNLHSFPLDGTVVPWIREGEDRRPFVRLGDGNVALVDTGSSFGLAISSSSISASNRGAQPSRDLGGGSFRVHRVAPSNVSIGSLSLNGIPTDILSGTDLAAPRLLGRDALNPFIISFDPLHRLIEIAPSVHDKYRPR